MDLVKNKHIECATNGRQQGGECEHGSIHVYEMDSTVAGVEGGFGAW